MTVRGVGFVGVRTENYDETVAFCRDALALGAPVSQGHDFAVFRLGDDCRFEVFGPTCPAGSHLGSAPFVGFTVDDVAEASVRLRAAGCTIVFSGEDGPTAWAHFVAPDGNLYEVMHDKSEPMVS